MESLPLFPLPILPLPGEQVGLFIFEPRYRALFDALESLEIQEFGIPFAHDGRLEGIGAVMRLMGVTERQPDGKRHVVVSTCDLFRLSSFDERPEDVPYPTGGIERLSAWRSWYLEAADVPEWNRLRAWIAREAAQRGDAPPPPHPPRHDSEPPLMVDAIRSLGLDARQRSALLSLDSHSRRQQLFRQLLQFTRLILDQERHMDRYISPN
jgi:Lon protease-like protein